MSRIEKNQKVTLAYSLFNTAGEVLEKVDNDNAIQYIHGYQMIFPKLEEMLEGCLEGSHLTLEVACDEAFGQYDSSKVSIVDRHELENIPNLQVGMEIAVLSEPPQFEPREEAKSEARDHFWTPQEPSDLYNDDDEDELEEMDEESESLLDEIFVVKEVHDLFVVLDSNHPFAGMDVKFEVDIIKVEAASVEEIEDLYNNEDRGPDFI